jgi:hypothetical protein
MSGDDYRPADDKPVRPAEVRAEMLFWNPPVVVLTVLLEALKAFVVFAAMVTPVPVVMVASTVP